VSTITRAAVFHGAGRPLELREFPLPVPERTEVLVEVVACTLCGSDLHSLHGRRTVPVPTVLGHEVLGKIVAFGATAARQDAAGLPIEVGDRVTWAIVASCGECFYCRRDLAQKCERQTKYGHEPLRPGRELTGGLAHHCLLVSGTALFRVPEQLPDAAACPANCATATVAAALEAAGQVAGRSVLVMGCGMLGLTATAWARSLGATCVIACDVEAGRLALAETFGATSACPPDDLSRVVQDTTSGYGVDIALELTGEPTAFEALFPLARLGGSLILVGAVFPSRPIAIVAEQIVRRCLAVRGIHNYAPRHLRAALEFLAAHPSIPFPALVGDWQPLSSLEQVLSTSPAPSALRIGIRPGA
jgi:putative phosphonate catabolism associated alcohol dehydrogenase